MAEKTTKKNTKGTKKTVEKKTTKKVATKKTAPKKVTSKQEVTVKKEEVKEVKVVTPKEVKKEGKIEKVFDKIMDNRPFAISLCVIIILAVALGITLFTKRIPKTSKGKQVVATVKGKTITADDLYLALKDEYGTDKLINMIDEYIAKKEVKFTKDDEKYIQDIVDEWKAQAESYGMTLPQLVANYGLTINNDDEFFDFLKDNYSKSLAVINFIGDEASKDELKSFYEENYSDEITVRHILINIDDDEDYAYNRAMELIGELDGLTGDELVNRFSELASDNSDDTGTYSNGGLVENTTKKTVVSEFYDASANLKDGEYTKEPVKTQFGYHVILRISSKKVESFDKMKDQVKRDYGEQVLNSDPNLQVKKWDELRKSYKLNIVDSNIKEQYNKTINK